MFLRALASCSLLAAVAGVLTTVPERLGAISSDPGAIQRICEIAMADARWQDPPLFGKASISPGPVVVEITGQNMLFVCPARGGARSHIVAIAECPRDRRQNCTARRYR